MPERSGLIPGNIEAVPAGEGAGHYIVIHKHRKEEEKKQEEGKNKEQTTA